MPFPAVEGRNRCRNGSLVEFRETKTPHVEAETD